MTTLDQRVAALPDHQQSAFLAFLEYLEWKAGLPTYQNQIDKVSVGARLRTVRETLRQSEDEAATVAGITLETYQRYEQGRIGRWATGKMIGYAETWNVSLDWLLDGDGTMFRGDQPPQILRKPAVRPDPKPVSNVIDWKSARATKGGAA